MEQTVHKYFRGERGASTAEFAVLLPVVVVIVGIVLQVVALGMQQIRIEEAAASAARMAARAEPEESIAAAVTRIAGHRSGLGIGSSTGWVTVTVESPVPGMIGWFDVVTLKARAHAPNEWTVDP